jgi:F420H(2)-dependent quinone reductase
VPRVEGIGEYANALHPHVIDQAELTPDVETADVELSPTDWIREQTERILEQGTTDGVEFMDRPVVLVTTTGARSGRRRYVPVMRVEKDGRYAMIASNGGAAAHPAW